MNFIICTLFPGLRGLCEMYVKLQPENVKGRNHFGDLCKRIVLKCISKEAGCLVMN
jgi:hypothetical protein